MISGCSGSFGGAWTLSRPSGMAISLAKRESQPSAVATNTSEWRSGRFCRVSARIRIAPARSQRVEPAAERRERDENTLESLGPLRLTLGAGEIRVDGGGNGARRNYRFGRGIAFRAVGSHHTSVEGPRIDQTGPSIGRVFNYSSSAVEDCNVEPLASDSY